MVPGTPRTKTNMALENHQIFHRIKVPPRFAARVEVPRLKTNVDVLGFPKVQLEGFEPRFRTEVFLAPFLPFFPPKFGSTGGFPPNIMFVDLGVSKNRGTPKWMVYNGKPY